MVKLKSPFFSDMRGKLGESGVFSMWKGRLYLRSYTKPANPQTNSQQAGRMLLKELVQRWQATCAGDTETADWNEQALPYQISGYNLFTKYGARSEVSVPESGSTGVAFDVTYTLGFPAGDARLVRYADEGDAWQDVTPAGGLEAGEDNTVSVTEDMADDFTFYLAYKPICDTAGSFDDTKLHGVITKWSKDTGTGTADEAVITVS